MLGSFNLTLAGHGECINIIKKWGVPLMLLGGGGYTIKNVARCWAYETAVSLGMENDLDNNLPLNEYYEYYGPDHHLHISKRGEANKNSKEYLDYILAEAL